MIKQLIEWVAAVLATAAVFALLWAVPVAVCAALGVREDPGEAELRARAAEPSVRFETGVAR